MSERQASESINADESDLIGEKLALTSSHSRASPCSVSLSLTLILSHIHTKSANASEIPVRVAFARELV